MAMMLLWINGAAGFQLLLNIEVGMILVNSRAIQIVRNRKGAISMDKLPKTIKISETEVVRIDHSEHTNWPEHDQGMTDRQFAKEASQILHNMALERQGFWAQLFHRWHISSEPLRNDAAGILKRYGFNYKIPADCQYVGDDRNI